MHNVKQYRPGEEVISMIIVSVLVGFALTDMLWEHNQGLSQL